MKPIINREIRAKYEVLQTLEAGLVLTGAEVKSIKKGGLNLKGAFVGFEKNELWLKNAHIAAYQNLNQPGYTAERPRKILLTHKEINSLIGKLQTKGLTLVPEKVYSTTGLVKIAISLVRGLKKYDRREKIKKRDTDRKIAYALKQRN